MKKILFILAIAAGMLTGCDSIDCTLNNTVECKMGFYDAKGNPVALTDTLSVLAYGSDSILYNRGIRTGSLGLPLSYYKDKDTLVFLIQGEDYRIQERLIIYKQNYEHFESLDCPVNMFHTLTNLECTKNVIDSVVIVSPQVEYNNGENIKIYLHTDD